LNLQRLPGRTDNAIKNRWNSTMRKRAMPDLLDKPIPLIPLLTDVTNTLACLAKAASANNNPLPPPPSASAPSSTGTRSAVAAAAAAAAGTSPSTGIPC